MESSFFIIIDDIGLISPLLDCFFYFRLFAATPRGAALINRIKTDPQLATPKCA